jgi:Mn2+/Fe2+ NRAMP family transporter
MMLLLVIVNFGNVIAEFSGIAGSLQLFHLSKYISVPICAALVWALVVFGDYKNVEKIFLAASVFYIAYIIAGVLGRPDWHAAMVETVKLPAREVWSDRNYIYMTIGVIGTTITPWMQFYLQSSIVEKGVSVRQYRASRLDVIVGSIFTDIVAWFIVVVCAVTLYTHGMRDIQVPADAAEAMKPVAGDYAFILFAAGLFNASLFAASILPLSTAYTVCEGLGFESGVDKRFGQAPFFYWLYTILIVAGAAVVLIPNFPLVPMTILSQVLNGVLLPIVLIFMLKLINRKELMGTWTNNLWLNLVAWTTAVVVIGLTAVMLWNTIQGLF